MFTASVPKKNVANQLSESLQVTSSSSLQNLDRAVDSDSKLSQLVDVSMASEKVSCQSKKKSSLNSFLSSFQHFFVNISTLNIHKQLNFREILQITWIKFLHGSILSSLMVVY